MCSYVRVMVTPIVELDSLEDGIPKGEVGDVVSTEGSEVREVSVLHPLQYLRYFPKLLVSDYVEAGGQPIPLESVGVGDIR